MGRLLSLILPPPSKSKMVRLFKSLVWVPVCYLPLVDMKTAMQVQREMQNVRIISTVSYVGCLVTRTARL